jgi:hypothetical protein
MKKTIVLALAFLALQSNAQKDNVFNSTKISEYTISEMDVKKDIFFKKSDFGNYNLYLEGFSHDALSNKTGIILNKGKHLDFLINLRKAKDKYIEWVEIAKNNNVKDMSKNMDFSIPCPFYFYLGNNFNIDLYNEAFFEFKVKTDANGNTKYLLMVSSKVLKSIDNEFIKSDGMSIIFNSTKEIDYLLNEISIEQINKLLNEPNKEDLFK